MKKVKTFSFDKVVDAFFVEKEIIQAIFTTEEVFGKPKVKSSLKYCVKSNKAVMLIFNEIGDHVFKVFRERIDHSIGRGRYSLKET